MTIAVRTEIVSYTLAMQPMVARHEPTKIVRRAHTMGSSAAVCEPAEMMRHTLAVETLAAGRPCLWHRLHPAQGEHRSHFGSRYKLGCCGHAGLPYCCGIRTSAMPCAHTRARVLLCSRDVYGAHGVTEHV